MHDSAPWEISQGVRDYGRVLETRYPGVKGAFYIDQTAHGHLGDGACMGFTESFISAGARHGTSQGVIRDFGRKVHDDTDGIKNFQSNYRQGKAQRRDEYVQQANHLSAHIKSLGVERERLKMQFEALPKGSRERAAVFKELKLVSIEINSAFDELEGMPQQDFNHDMKKLGGGMSCTPKRYKQNIGELDEFVDDMRATAQDPGMYSLILHGKDGDHATGFQVRPDEHMFMDPNTALFTTPGHEDLVKVATHHVGVRYDQQYDQYSLNHHKPSWAP